MWLKIAAGHLLLSGCWCQITLAWRRLGFETSYSCPSASGRAGQREGNNIQEIACPLLSGVQFSPPDKCFIQTGRSFSVHKWTMKRDSVIFGNKVQIFTYSEENVVSVCLFYCQYKHKKQHITSFPNKYTTSQ